jgi:transcriptional regulator with XRE-family HTH domain
MAKRKEVIKETMESKALKAFRVGRDLSLRKLADSMGLSKSRVAQLESGKGKVTEEYIQKFLSVMEISNEAWGEHNVDIDEVTRLKDLCFEIVSEFDEKQLNKVLGFMDKISNSATY